MERIIRLDTTSKCKPFCCSDEDLNGFFMDDALNYGKDLMTVTYILETEQKTIAYFSLLNDKITLRDINSRWRNRINRNVSNQKRNNSYPAVKLGRLAVSEEFEKRGYGTKIIGLIKQWFTEGNKTGCRYITVDAYAKPEVLSFYEKNGFDYLTNDDKDAKTRLMYYDSKNFVISE